MKIFSLLAAAGCLAAAAAFGAAGAQETDDADGPMTSETFSGLKLRNIGPALKSGRIADIVVMPHDPATWIVGVGSGGVWRTDNAGATWTPIFDDETSYSIGAVSVDPTNPSVIWVGTGENHGGRHNGFGDGIYRSKDGGGSWEHLGLETSEHISKIIVHPDDPDTVWVASQGPLWSKGGERGVYKTTDGGKTWANVLAKGPWTGATDLVIDPRHPDRLYAAMWQHHRTVAGYVGGGPESGLYASEDGGKTWTELTNGLPKGNKGKIGLALSPQKPDVVYAAIELDQREGGVWRSENRGASWTKMSDEVSGGTGPHYYQELYASPHEFDRLYLVSNYSVTSGDGGKTWKRINGQNKHVDDHAIAFRPDDPDYILFGSDGGLYESYDAMKSWRYIDNLPVTQFYKVAVDDAEPFYNVYGGTQDNNSQGGPSRTDNIHGVQNHDWFVTLWGDGHQSATEPGNPDIMYAESQQGNLVRVDTITGEFVFIQPQAAPGEPMERFNWDAPILVSAHDPKRIYFASQRVWRSDDRGDSWTAISQDLTRNEDRMQIPHMGRKWSWDAPWDLYAMSNYNTITSLGESPLDENIVYVGTDDGLIQVTENGGESWRTVEVGALPGVPDTAFVNDIRADLHDANVVYIALDNHKYGDYAPYLLKSEDRGRSWTKMTGDLPERHLVWRIVQDDEDPDLFFLATEFGLFFTVDGGGKWVELTGDVPNISFRDVTIQRREDDVVAASFGRGFFILDDYAALRDLAPEDLEKEAVLWPGRDALWYVPRFANASRAGGEFGTGHYIAPNPDFGAVFTYHLGEGLKSLEDVRQDEEKPKAEAGEDTPFPGFDAIDEELAEVAPEIVLTVRNAEGEVVRRLSGPTTKGFHRVAWDLRLPSTGALSSMPDEDDDGSGWLAPPGEYTVSLSKRVRGKTTQLVGPQPFTVRKMRDGALDGPSMEALTAYTDRLASLQRRVSAANATLSDLDDKADLLKAALSRTRAAPTALDDEWRAIRAEIDALETALRGSQARREMGLDGPATVGTWLGAASSGVRRSTYGPTPSHLQWLTWAEEGFAEMPARIEALRAERIPAFEQALYEAGGPWTPGAPIPGE